MNEPTDYSEPYSRSVIIKFPRKRGRPKLSREYRDNGTPELALKRLQSETSEALDLCLDRELITRDQHWCGIHLRWLYTLRHGAPGVRAIDPTHLGGVEISPDDPEWRSLREREYNEAMMLLALSGHALMLLNVCVHNERPAFLRIRPRMTQKHAVQAERGTRLLRDGLDVLAKHWGR